MPLTEEQKLKLDNQDEWPCFARRLNRVSHEEIEQTFARALESLVGGHFSIEITSWGNGPTGQYHEQIIMSAKIDAYTPSGSDAANSGND
jgi:hypothetical protein